jgi:hypothetical protein
MQDLMYSLAVKHLFPDYPIKQSEFLFLKFELDTEAKKSGIMRMEPLSEEDLYGFELQLTEVQQYLDNFTEKDAVANFAAYKGFPNDNSFSGKLPVRICQEKRGVKEGRQYKVALWYEV